MVEQGNFFVKCHNIYYNQQWLVDVLDSLKPSDWVNGVSRTGVAWTVSECRNCLLYTSPSPRDVEESRMPSSA